jgi:sensor histidine kinase YesM
MAWTLFGLLTTSQTYMSYSNRELPFPWGKMVLLTMGYAYLWAALTPLILFLARRFPMERTNWQRNILTHLFIGIFIGFATRAAHDAAYFFLFAYPAKTFSFFRLIRNAYLIFDYGLLIYAVILLVYYVLEYYGRYQAGELKSSRLETQLAQAQLQALKMQLQPHFLFNTLNSIAALLHRNKDAADTMIARLGDFLRITLENSGTQEVSLKEELDFLKCYLQIEQIRFQDRLSVSLDIEAAALPACLPNLILQPIVENAIRHGIAPRSAPGHIDIQARRLNGTLQVQVTDDGPGIVKKNGSLFKEGLGLANTQARLQQLYGGDYKLDLENVPRGGLAVTIEIPFKARKRE